MFVMMKSALAMMRRKKIQMSLIAIILLLVSALSYIGFSMLGQKSPYGEMAKRANATESLYLLNLKVTDLRDTGDFIERQGDVSGVSLFEGLLTTAEINGDRSEKGESLLCYLTAAQADPKWDLMYADSAAVATVPTGNQVQLNYNLAKSKGLEIGDTMTVLAGERRIRLTVSQLVVDPQFSNAFMSPDRMIVAPDFFQRYGVSPDTGIVGVKFDSWTKAKEDQMFKDLKAYVGEEKAPLQIGYESIVNSYNIIFGIIAAILLVVSLFIIVIVALVIRSTVGNMILQQYKSIGVKKVIGYTNGQIRNSFLVAYVLLGAVTSLLGVALGIPVRRMINEGISHDMQLAVVSKLDGTLALTVLLICGLLAIFTLLATAQANRIRPVQAIKYGMPEYRISRNKFRISHYKALPLTTLLALKQLSMHKRKTMTTVFMLALIVYAAIIINNMGQTLGDSHHFLKYLTGTRVGNYSVTDSKPEKVQATLDKLEQKKDTAYATFVMMQTSQSIKAMDGSSIGTGGQVFYGSVPEDLVQLTAGRAPKSEDEIILSGQAAKEAGKAVGDYVSIYTGKETEKYLIAGLFNTVTYNARGYVRVIPEIPAELTQERGYFWVFTKSNSVIIEEVRNDLAGELSENALIAEFDTNMSNVLSTLAPFGVTVKTLLVIFMIVCGVIVLNWTIMDINSMTRAYGVFKALGFTKNNIVQILVQRAFIVTLTGVATGLAANYFTANAVMDGVIKMSPFNTVRLPMEFDLEGSLIIVALFLLVTWIATIIPSQRLKKISPKNLIAE